ncbi:MAG TPA: hypothetical protein VIH85_06200 [Solirubrobacteraceae bacterium]
METVARYALGVAALAVICASLALVAVAIRRRALPDWTGAPARLAEAVIGLAALIAILELLGAVGLFRLGPVVVAALLAALATRRWASLRSASLGPGRPVRSVAELREPVLLGVLAVLGAATVIAEWGALTIQSYDVGIRGFDSLWYHLPWAASFAQTGNIVSLRFTDVEYLTPFYPATAEAVHGLGIVLLGRDTLSPGLNLVWLALVLLAAYCIGRRRGAGAGTLLGAAVAMATSMMDYSQAGAAANDVVAVFFLLAAVAFLIDDPENPPALVLAAVAAGLAVGVKLTVLGPVLGLTIGVVAIAPRGRRLHTAGLWLGPLLLAGGFWYVRNLIAVGNPLPWTSLGGLLPTPAPPLQQHTGFSVAHYVTSGHFWSAFAQPALASGLGGWWWALLAGAIIGPLLCLLSALRPPSAPRRLGRNPAHMGVSSRATIGMLGAVALFSLAAYLVTPETAAGPAGNPLGFAFNLRYLAPALTLSLVVLPLAPAFEAPAARAALAVALAAALLVTVAEPALWPAHVPGAVLIAVVGGLAVAALVAVARVTRPGIAIGLAAALAVIVAIAGYPLQRHYLRGRYAYQPGVSYLAPVWALFRTVHDARVGVVGTFGGFFAYPLYGLDLSNRVQYVAQRGPHGSFTPITTCARWRAQVNSDHLNYLLTTPARDPWHPKVLSASPESAWTGSDPAAQPVYRKSALGQPIVLYRIRGLLNPAACG